MRAPALLVLPLALAAAACGSSSSPSTPATTPTPAASSSHASLSTRSISGLGTVLVNSQGRTLYAFTPEKGGKLVCTGSCASLWPAFTAASGQKPSASGSVTASMISTVTGSSGSVVTYDGWPLHTYASDSGPGSAAGQGIGGKWYVISPSGTLITKKAASSSSGSSGGYGGGGY